ncbi:MAG: tRNA 2-thiouridine(34) synthase MnmA [Candidatus Coprovivens sp.]
MKRVLIGMSGGVDSSVAAYLLQKEGYEVVGLTMSLFNSNKEEGCTSSKAVEDAAKVCQKLGIEHHVVDYKKDFKCHIIDYFINSYLNAETPNPCVECNKFLKFGLMWDEAKKLNCDYIATGHYAAIIDNKLCRIDSPKDQTYFLYQIDKELLNKILFPLQNYTNKEDIRRIAASIGLEVHDKKDSQDICFIESNDYTKYLEENIDKLPNKGNFILKDGTIIGEHKGIIYYTIGQRKGLGISYQHPLYVTNINKQTNEITLGTEQDLYSTQIEITNINILVDEIPSNAQAKIRYRYELTPCTIKQQDEDTLLITFSEPVKSATIGQSLVIYDNNVCIGGGKITNIK